MCSQVRCRTSAPRLGPGSGKLVASAGLLTKAAPGVSSVLGLTLCFKPPPKSLQHPGSHRALGPKCKSGPPSPLPSSRQSAIVFSTWHFQSFLVSIHQLGKEHSLFLPTSKESWKLKQHIKLPAREEMYPAKNEDESKNIRYCLSFERIIPSGREPEEIGGKALNPLKNIYIYIYTYS